MDLYADNILDHYRDPRHKVESGKWKTESVITHSEANISCGDEITVALKIKDHFVTSIEWSGTGCAISQAGMSIFAEEFEGHSADALLKMKKSDIYELLGVPVGPRRFKCALICLHTVKNALRKHSGKDPQSWLETVEIDQ
jgi:nitrogen fixation NifU-like protein